MTGYDQALAYDAGISYDGATTDRTPGLNLVFEVAFATDPDDPSPVWVDLTSRLDLDAGVSITRGREDEYAQIQPGRMTVTLDNHDGALTPENASSPYYPNVLPQRRCRLAYEDPSSGARRYRLDGHIDEWPVEWPGGSGQYSSSVVTVTDMLARIGARQKLRSVVVETMALNDPVVHFPLNEPDGSTMVTNIVGSDPITLGIGQSGTGGTIEFAAATGVPTDGKAAPNFAAVNNTNGKYLYGSIPTVGAGAGVSLVAAFSTSATPAAGGFSIVAALSDGAGNRLLLKVTDTGALVGTFHIGGDGTGTPTVSGPNVVDGLTHHAQLVATDAGALNLFLDGVLVDSVAGSALYFTPWNVLTVGGWPWGPSGQGVFTGAIAHVAVYDAALTVTEALAQRQAQSTGFAGERSDQRIARICTWIGLPTTRQDLDVGKSTNIGHLDCTGMTPLEYMRKIEATEAGLLWVSADGKLTFHNRAHSYGTTAPAVSLPSRLLDAGTRLAKNLLLVKNIITGSRSGGATVRAVDQASVDAYGPLSEDLEVVVGTDALVADAVAWRLNTGSEPRLRFTNLDIDAYTDAVYSPLIIDDLIIDGRIEITGLPSQAPTSTMRQTVQGYTETITHSRWSLSVNATPYEHMVGLILDDATYGTTDSTNHIVY